MKRTASTKGVCKQSTSPLEELQLIKEERQIPLSFRAGPSRETTYRRGIAQLTEPPFDPDFDEQANPALWFYQRMRELDGGDGLDFATQVLSRYDLCVLGPDRRESLITAVKAKRGGAVWDQMLEPMLAPELAVPASVFDHFLVAAWAELYLEPLSEAWMAAMAVHARLVCDDVAFATLVSILRYRRRAERDYLSGRKSADGARAGAQTQAQRRVGLSLRIVAEMRRLKDERHSLSRAAELAARNGFGKSAQANRKLWYRYQSKRWRSPSETGVRDGSSSER